MASNIHTTKSAIQLKSPKRTNYYHCWVPYHPLHGDGHWPQTQLARCRYQKLWWTTTFLTHQRHSIIYNADICLTWKHVVVPSCLLNLNTAIHSLTAQCKHWNQVMKEAQHHPHNINYGWAINTSLGNTTKQRFPKINIRINILSKKC